MKTDKNNQPVELGTISWYRNYEEALEQSNKINKPIFLLFQEIPGCSTCVNFGNEILSDPLLVDVIENEFVPLAIYNNKGGEDKRILDLFNEPSWNNPVVYFLNEKGESLVSKITNPWNASLLIDRVIGSLEMANKDIPNYIIHLQNQYKIRTGIARVGYIETPCFWSGETSMIQHPAVITTEAGWMGSKEVVKFYYDPSVDTLDNIIRFGREQGFYAIDQNLPYRIDKDPQYYVQKSPFKNVPLINTQRSVINYLIPYNGDILAQLSPSQLELLPEIAGFDASKIKSCETKPNNV